MKISPSLHGLLAAVLTLVGLAIASCGGAGKELPEAPLTREELAARAVDKVEAAGLNVFRVRYNPPACPCPPFELEVADRWVRIFLRDDDPDAGVAESLVRAAKEAEADAGAAVFYAVGSPDPDRFRPCSTGFPVMEFTIESFSEDPPVEPQEPGEDHNSATPAPPQAP